MRSFVRIPKQYREEIGLCQEGLGERMRYLEAGTHCDTVVPGAIGSFRRISKKILACYLRRRYIISSKTYITSKSYIHDL
jgi:hypothetical protein